MFRNVSNMWAFGVDRRISQLFERNMVRLPRYRLLLALALVAIAWTASSVTTEVMGPPQDRDLRLYAALYSAAATGKVDRIEAAATKVADNASDPDLRSYAQLVARQNQQAQRLGFKTVEEQSTWSGLAHSFLSGWSDLDESYKGLMITVDTLLGNHGAVWDRYYELLKARTTATRLGWLHFWLIMFAGMLLYVCFRRSIDPLLLNFILGIPLLERILTREPVQSDHTQGQTDH